MDTVSLWDAQAVKVCCKPGCTNPAGLQHKQCDACRERSRQSVTKLYAKRRAAGMCFACGKVATANGKRCEQCSAKQLDWLHTSYLEQHYKNAMRYKNQLRSRVLEAYGGVCACCGESDPVFLTIDHINNDGATLRREFGNNFNEFRWMIANGFPPGYQVLCFNCNCGRHFNGGICPHLDPIPEPEPHVPWKPKAQRSKAGDTV